MERVQFLNDKGIAPRRQLDDANTALAVANSDLEQHTAAVEFGSCREREPKTSAPAQIRVQQAQQTLAQSKTSGDAKVLASASRDCDRRGKLRCKSE